MSGLSITQARNRLRTILGLDDVDLDDTAADLLLNQSLWWLQSILKIPANEVITTIATVAGTVNYTLTYPTEALLAVSLRDPDTDELKPLLPISGWARDDLYSYDVEQQGKPEYYERFGREFYLQPIPDDVYTLQLRRKDLIADLSSSTTQIAMDSVLHEVLVYGAAERGFIDLRDFNSSDRMKREWGVLLQGYSTQEQTEQSNWKYAGVKVIRPPYRP